MNDIKKIAFLGVGLMGLPMAKNLLKAGYSLSVWNRSHEKALPLANLGATLNKRIEDVAVDADLVISMLTDGAVVAEIIDNPELRKSLSTGAIWVDMSSTKPNQAQAFAQSLAALEVSFADAPVSGGTRGAEDATLAIMAGAGEQEFARLVPVLSTLGRVVHVGPVGAGQLAKLANQLIVAATIGAVAEAMLLLENGGANPDSVRDALRGGFADSAILQQHGERMTTRNFTPGGLSSLQLKDLENILAQADEYHLELPIAQQMRDRFERYVSDLNGADKDHSGIFEELMDINS